MSAMSPLCVDLDGTLIRSDILHEGLCALAAELRIFSVLSALLQGRAALKHAVARQAPADPALLPYNETLLTYLRTQKAAGRMIVLATAADRSVAAEIAEYLGLFDEVVASDGGHNLKGNAKANALVARFGAQGFCYAGNEAADLPIWQLAGSAIIVNASASVTAKARAAVPVELVIADRTPVPRELLRAMRPHQWVKNILAFVPILTAHALTETQAWVGACLMFVAFSATASGIYLINDLVDIAADRAHPSKRRRPFARGAIPIPIGVLAAVLLVTAGISLGWAAHVAWVLIAYAAMSVAYSFFLKQLPLVDVFMLAGLYTIRLFGGGEATGHRLTPWLLGFSSFLFLSLALLKRVEEMMSLAAAGTAKPSRRGYAAADVQALQMFGVASAFAASIVLALFVQNDLTAQRYESPGLLSLLVPLILFWLCRMWLSGARGYMHHDPIIYAIKDWVSWTIGGVLVLVVMAAKSLPLNFG